MLFQLLLAPALAGDLYGAIAVGAPYRRAATSNHPTFESAKQAVLKDCGTGCILAVWFRNQNCGAVVMDGTQQVYWAWAASSDQADLLAQQRCKSSGADPCYSIQMACNTRKSGSGKTIPPWLSVSAPRTPALEAASAPKQPASDPAEPAMGGSEPPR